MSKKCGDFGGKNNQELPCGHGAGARTSHKGEGKCWLHGGADGIGRPIIHGRYSVKHRQSLHDKMQEFLDDPAPANLMHELAVERAFLQDFLSKISGNDKIDIKTTNHVFDMTEAISRLVERISRMLNQTAITQMEITFLQATITNLIVKYIDDPTKRLEFVAELRSAFGSDRQSSGTAALTAPAYQSVE